MIDCLMLFIDFCLFDIKVLCLIDFEYIFIYKIYIVIDLDIMGMLIGEGQYVMIFFFEIYYVFLIYGFGENVDLYFLLIDLEQVGYYFFEFNEM